MTFNFRYRLFFQIIFFAGVLSAHMQFAQNSAAQEDQTTVSLSTVRSTSQTDLVVQVDLKTAENTHYAAGAFVINYNPIALEPVDCQVQSSFLGVCNHSRPGEVLFNALNAQGVKGDLTLVEVSFKVINSGSLNLDLQMTEPMVNPLGYSIEAAVSQPAIENLNTDLTGENYTSVVTELNDSDSSFVNTDDSADLPAVTEPSAEESQQDNSASPQKTVNAAPTTSTTPLADNSTTNQIKENQPVITNENQHTQPSADADQTIPNANHSNPTSWDEPNPDATIKQEETTTHVQVFEDQAEEVSQIAEASQSVSQPLGQTDQSNQREKNEYTEKAIVEDSTDTRILWIGLIMSIALLATCIFGAFLTINKNRND